MSWLDVLRGPGYGNTLNGSSATYTDPATGRMYRAVFSGGGSYTEQGYDPGVLVNYIGTDGPWYEGQIGQVYDLNGNVTSEFKVEDFRHMDAMDKIIAATVGTIVAFAAAGAAGFGPAAAGASSAEVSAAASLTAGESIVPTALAPAAAAPTTLAAAGGGASLLSTAGGLAKTVLGGLTALTTLKAQTASRNATQVPQYVTQPAGLPASSLQLPSLAGLTPREVLVAGVVGIAALVISMKKG